jgi:pimeloyl-ACP methyl ester carboxylesterase
MALKLEAAEHGSGPPVVILHGLFGSSRNWAGIARQLAADHRVLALDLRNHGASPWADSMDYAEQAADVRRTLDERGVARTMVIGHSMGGKTAMLLAFAEPERVERLIVADVAPVGYPPVLRAYAEAMLDVDLSRLSRRGEVDQALAAAIPEAPIRAFLLQNLVSEQGRYRWRLNLPVLAREMETISGFPELPPGTAYDGPTLFLHGGASDYVTPAAEPAIRRLFPAARLAAIAGAGHWLHAERPKEFLAAVAGFEHD